METYTCEQLAAVINDPTTDTLTRAQAQALFVAKCGAGGGGAEPQSGNNTKPPRLPSNP